MPKLTEAAAVNSITSSDLLYVVASNNSRKITAGNLIASLTDVRSAPTGNAYGAAGDIKGMIAFDSTYFYVCTADYTGTSNVWKRVALTTW
jgi:hypothetical protein